MFNRRGACDLSNTSLSSLEVLNSLIVLIVCNEESYLIKVFSAEFSSRSFLLIEIFDLFGEVSVYLFFLLLCFAMFLTKAGILASEDFLLSSFILDGLLLFDLIGAKMTSVSSLQGFICILKLTDVP